jgi:DNA-binding NtrC family response regulator
VIQLDIPSLRERRDDIPVLVDAFIGRFCARLKKETLSLSASALQTLLEYDWPGNVRELENTIERAALLCKGSEIEAADFPERVRSQKTEQVAVVSDAEPANPTLESIEKAYIHFVMSQTDGNKAKAAKILGIDNSTLYRRLERYGWSKKKS